MFQLTSHSIVQFSSLIIYITLISFALYSKQVRLKRLFSLFLMAAAGTSLCNLLVNLRLPYEQLVLWKMLVLPFSTWLIVAYAHFAVAFAHRDTRRVARSGYGWLAITLALVVFGYFTQGLNFLDNEFLATYYTYVITALNLVNELIAISMVFFLVKSLRSAAEPEERNRTAYLLAGLSLMVLADVMGHIFQGTSYPIAQIGYAGNAVVMTYTLLKYRLLDIQVLMKKWMVYTGVTICITLAYLALLLGISNLLRLLPPQLGIPATVIMVFLFACLFNWVKAALDKGADRLFYGNRYLHRKMLLDFASRTSNFINIKDIANALVGPLVRAIKARQVGLLLPANGCYATKFVASLNGEEEVVPLMLPRNSLLTQWLESKGAPLVRANLEDNPEFSRLPAEEKSAIDMSGIELLCPIVSKHRLVGILALGGKTPHGHFTRDDLDLVSVLAKESAVAIENAQIYASAREKADTDELTGLHNHRYFQERFNQEIEKSALSGDDFSLLFIDLDFFKTYNDVYGHVLGDEILKDVGQIIRTSIRAEDIGARYGGDEFAAILLHTAVEGAQAVAERIRQRLEAFMNQRGLTLTCSIGVASWQVDGIVRGRLIQAADEALYAAKRAGRNRVCLASKLDIAEPVKQETTLRQDDSDAVENIVFALAATVDARDHYTYGHSKAVSRYATELAGAIGYTKEGIQRIRAAALLHDIGKLNIPDSILSKTGQLADEEWDMMKHHPELGVEILKYIVGLRGCVDAVLFHHERFDGKGYPKGLKGDSIPVDARIMAIADAYDAMTSQRGYREGRLSEVEAIRELEKCAGTQFDPNLIDVFIGLRRKAMSLLSGLEKDLAQESYIDTELR
jgi:diguanylate cyclase (GGDEF)-like protein/putative nucleotidyltransferase with HDIG domain